MYPPGGLSRTGGGLKSFAKEPGVESLPIREFPKDGFARTGRACLPESQRHVAAVAVHDGQHFEESRFVRNKQFRRILRCPIGRLHRCVTAVVARVRCDPDKQSEKFRVVEAATEVVLSACDEWQESINSSRIWNSGWVMRVWDNGMPISGRHGDRTRLFYRAA
jgi:hypothetical protein